MKHRLIASALAAVLTGGPGGLIERLHAGNLGELAAMATRTETYANADSRVTQAEHDRKSVLKGYYPSLTLGASSTHLSDTGELSPNRTDTLSGVIDVVLYDGGRREASLSRHRALIDASLASREQTRESLTLQTIRVYFDALSAQSAQSAKVREIRQLQAELERLEKFALVGNASPDEVERIRARLALGEAELTALELNVRLARTDLRKLIRHETDIEPGSYLLEPDASLKGRRPDLRARAHQNDALAQAVEAERAETLPSLTLQNTLSASDYGFEHGRPSGWDTPRTFNRVDLAARWKVFDFGATDQAVQSARIAHLIGARTLKQEERFAELDRTYTLDALALARDRIRASEARLKAAEITFDAVRRKFRAGVVDNVSYLTALTDRFDAQASLDQSKNAYEIRKAEYWNVAGIPLMEKIK